MTIPIELKSNRSVEYNIYIDKFLNLSFNRKSCNYHESEYI